jgi:hypothetical protein
MKFQHNFRNQCEGSDLTAHFLLLLLYFLSRLRSTYCLPSFALHHPTAELDAGRFVALHPPMLLAICHHLFWRQRYADVQRLARRILSGAHASLSADARALAQLQLARAQHAQDGIDQARGRWVGGDVACGMSNGMIRIGDDKTEYCCRFHSFRRPLDRFTSKSASETFCYSRSLFFSTRALSPSLLFSIDPFRRCFCTATRCRRRRSYGRRTLDSRSVCCAAIR